MRARVPPFSVEAFRKARARKTIVPATMPGCRYCGAVLSLARVVKPTDTDYEYACESCAVADGDARDAGDGTPRRSPRATND